MQSLTSIFSFIVSYVHSKNCLLNGALLECSAVPFSPRSQQWKFYLTCVSSVLLVSTNHPSKFLSLCIFSRLTLFSVCTVSYAGDACRRR